MSTEQKQDISRRVIEKGLNVSRSRTIAYWGTTVLLVAELGLGGVWDLPNTIRPRSRGALGYRRTSWSSSALEADWCSGVAVPPFPTQGVGLRRRVLHLYGSSRLHLAVVMALVRLRPIIFAI
jgi:hypothetical protein